MGEEAITSGRQTALREATILLDLTIIRSRGSSLLEGRAKEPVQGARKRPSKSLATHEAVWRCNGNAHKEVTTMWSKLFGGGDGLPREKVDAVVHVIERYLAEEAELRRLQSCRQEPYPWPRTGDGQVTHSALLQPGLSCVATFFIGFFTILIVEGGSVLFTYWISKDE